MTIVGIPAGDVATVWPLVRPWVDRYIDRFGEPASEKEMLQDFADKHLQLWVVTDDRVVAFATTRITTDGAVEIPMCAGEQREAWQGDLLDTITAWGAENGAKRIRIIGRPGWAAFLRSKGMRETHRIMERDIG